MFVQSTNDEFGPLPAFDEFFQQVEGEKKMVWIESRDHFFVDAQQQLEDAIAALGSA